jgi:hypothetical protein
MGRRIMQGAIVLGIVGAIAAVWLLLFSPSIAMIQCDGSVPISFIPEDYNNSGCVPVPDGWFDGNAAEQYADEVWVCLGLCGPDALIWDPARHTVTQQSP